MASAFGLSVRDLPDGYTPLDIVAIITCLDEEGRSTAIIRTTVMQDWEVVGLLRVAEWQHLTSSEWEDEGDEA